MVQKKYYSSLESLRGIAALMVCFEHVDYWCAFKTNTVLPNLYLFVDFFFVLSGFVIALNFSEKINTGESYKNYLIKRIFRLYPLFLITSIPYFMTSVLKTYYHVTAFQNSNYFKLTDFLTYITLTFKWGFTNELIFNQPTWSISVELFLYVIAGLLFLFSKNRKVNITVSILLVVSSFGLLYQHDHALVNTGYLSNFRGILSFFTGVIVYYLASSRKQDTEGHFALQWGWLIASAAFFVIIFRVIVVSPVYAFAFPVLFALVIYGMVNNLYPRFIDGFLNSKPMLYLGLISYSFYLDNPILTFVTEKIFKKDRMESNYWISIAGTLFLLGITIVVAGLTYKYIEIPGKNLYHKLTGKNKLTATEKGRAAISPED